MFRPNNIGKSEKDGFIGRIISRVAICVLVTAAVLTGFYASLVYSADPLTDEQELLMGVSMALLDERGFKSEVFLLKNLAVYRSNDNWLNASIPKENAYAATNFPFGIVTIYPDFFVFPLDDTERAAILLHEAKHLQGEDEKEAYEYVWKNRYKLGWTREEYSGSEVWNEVRKQTIEVAPHLFTCDSEIGGDCVY